MNVLTEHGTPVADESRRIGWVRQLDIDEAAFLASPPRLPYSTLGGSSVRHDRRGPTRPGQPVWGIPDAESTAMPGDANVDAWRGLPARTSIQWTKHWLHGDRS